MRAHFAARRATRSHVSPGLRKLVGPSPPRWCSTARRAVHALPRALAFCTDRCGRLPATSVWRKILGGTFGLRARGSGRDFVSRRGGSTALRQ